MGANLDGDWDAAMTVIRACRAKLPESSNRVSLSITVDDRRRGGDRVAGKAAFAKANVGACSAR